MIKSAKDAHDYALTHYPTFPNDWYISEHFLWNEVFANELKEYGVPALDIFNNAVKASVEFEKVRKAIGKPMNIHCWFRSMNHNLTLLKRYNDAIAKKLPPPNGKPAMHSSHLYGMAIDYDVKGMTMDAVRKLLAGLVTQKKLFIRIEAGTATWVHNDIGNPYTNNYTFGVFQP